MTRAASIFLCGIVIAVAGCVSPTSRLPIQLADGPVQISGNLTIWQEIRDRHVVLQGFDYSCGGAAMATLLTYYFQDPVTEQQVLDNIIDHLTDTEYEDRERKGLSLLDLKQYAQRRGYQAAGVKLELGALPELRGPVLVYLKKEGFKHFAVLRGIRGSRVFLADPARGNVRESFDEFGQAWPGIALVLGKKGFGTLQDYPLAVDQSGPVRPELKTARRALYLN